MVAGASLVCSVESTRWPGERGLDRDLGGLEVADLADHDDVRVLPQEGAQAHRRSSSPISSCICTWLMPCRLYSTGSSAVLMLQPGLLSSESAE